jgi:alkylhydroperoxidase family enzyme
MAFIRYIPEHDQAPENRVPDPDNIIQIHALHPAVMRHHYELYRALMHAEGPLSRREREMLAVRVSGLNHCPY